MKRILFYMLVILVLSSYIYSITPNDGFADGNALNSSGLLVVWGITFNVSSAEFTGEELNNVDISSCNYTGFNQLGDTTNPYGPYGFPPGNWECTFEALNYYNKTQSFMADNDKIVNVIMPEKGGATYQEHTWLEALYNCIILKDCDLWDLLLTINQTAANIWEHTKPTDTSVITSEVEISNALNSTSNITYDCTINIPVKSGYGLGDYLPVRIGYWFMNETNESCYSQGTLPEGVTVIEPYCNPLMVQTIGPMGGSVSFRVDLRPNLSTGTYNVKRIVEIDPNEQWEGYGQEVIGTIVVTEDVSEEGNVNLDKTGEDMPSSSSGTSSGGGSSGGSSGSNRGVIGNSVTNIYQNVTYIINQPENKEGKEERLENPWKYFRIEPAKENKESGLASITGAAIKKIKETFSGSSLIAVLIAIIIGLLGYIYGVRKRR